MLTAADIRILHVLSIIALLGCATASAGEIHGRIRSGSPVRRVVAIERPAKQKILAKEVRVIEHPGQLEADGSFRVEGLAAGTYDLLVETDDGTVFEGIRMNAAEAGGLSATQGDAGKAMSKRDVEKITAHVKRLKSFYDMKRVLALSGSGGSARALVELMRTKQTSFDARAKRPFVIWRIELWDYEKKYGTWIRVRWKPLRRFMMGVDKFRAFRWMPVPEAGGIVIAPEGKEASVELNLELPEPSRDGGRVGYPEERK